jgi:pimeloyl-ACP methyl ester carboxylesterase
MDDLHLLLRAAAIRPPYILVGHSIGGLYVRAYQRRYPEEVKGLVLVDATPEEDAEYLVNGVNKTGITMTYDEMASAYAPLIKNPRPPSAPPDRIEEPIDRLAPDQQRAWLWAIRKFSSEMDNSHWWITAESWKEEFVALRRQRLSTPHVLGDLPLIVLARGRRTTPVLDRREAELATMSRVGVERIAAESDHLIYVYQPELVTQAILDVEAMAARGDAAKGKPGTPRRSRPPISRGAGARPSNASERSRPRAPCE